MIADLEQSGLRDIVLVGHSQAGTVLPALAELQPDLFRRLIYVSCVFPLTGQTIVMQATEIHQTGSLKEWHPDMTPEEQARRFKLMFCTDMDEPEADTFVTKLGADSWPAQTYSATNREFPSMGTVPSS